MTETKIAEEFREILRKYPTGVTIVTSLLDGKPSGGTMNSFTSVSLNPPLIALFVTVGSRSANAISESRRFVVNILGERQEKYATTFANDKSEDKFSGIHYHMSEVGIPVLDECLGFLECDLYLEEEIADHIMFIGKVKKAQVLNDMHALVYHRRGFKSTIGLTPAGD